MENSLNILSRNLHLAQSELFGKYYGKTDSSQIHTFNDLSIQNLGDWYNSILNKYDFLKELQLKNFQTFLNSLESFLEWMSPEKLNINVDSNQEERDLLLWRESSQGISKLCFDVYGQITYVFNSNDGNKIRGVFENSVNMEKLLNRFLKL